jgi:hypothetical protein
MFFFPHSPEVGVLNVSRGVTRRESDKDLGNPAERVVAGLNSDAIPDVDPGKLTLEEGTSRWTVFSASHCFANETVDTRHGWWDWAPFRCIQLHNAHVPTPSAASFRRFPY